MEMKHNKKGFLFIEITLAILVMILGIIMIQGKNSEGYKISVIILDSDANYWSAFRYGLKMAAEDQDMELFVVSTADKLTAEEEMNLVNRELANGADAVIMQPVPGLLTNNILKSIDKKVPLMLVESTTPDDPDISKLPVVASDHYGMGRALAEQLIKNYQGSMHNKTIGIAVEDTEDRTGNSMINSRKLGFEDTLKDAGAKISWTVTAHMLKDDLNFYNNQLKSDFVIALDDNSLIAAAGQAAANNLHGALVYGIGGSTEAVYYLDTGAVECLVVPDGFTVGYQSLAQTALCLKHRFHKMKGQVIPYTLLHREELFSKENQEILFTMSQGF